MANEPTNDENGNKLTRYARVGQVFTPRAPINRYALFAGRLDQLRAVVDAINQRGQHAVLFGERGVGKTSLANILAEVFYDEETRDPVWSAKVNCNTTDDFHTLWSNIFREMGREDEFQAQWLERAPDPEDVRWLLQRLGRRLLVVIDELDRLDDDITVSQLADTIKTLSDHSVDVTLILVGVADSIDELVGDHRSVERALAQVPLQRMHLDELVAIIENGLDRLELAIADSAKIQVARLSEGLPHYTHLLALHAAQRAVIDERNAITDADVEVAIGEAVDKATQSIQSAYHTATRSPRKDSQFQQVLLACALAPKDDQGFFSAGAVRTPLSRIMGKDRTIASFAKHMRKFTEPSRGCVLQRIGEPRSYFYRFDNPLLQPYVVLSGLRHNLIAESVLTELQDEARGVRTDDETLSFGLE